MAPSRAEGTRLDAAIQDARLSAPIAGTPIFYPVLSGAYAVKIALDWNVPASGRGYVTRFLVAKTFLDRYQVQERLMRPFFGRATQPTSCQVRDWQAADPNTLIIA